MKRENFDGKKFNRWTVISDGKSVELKKPNGKPRYIRTLLCECECGTIREIRHGNLINGISQSCGCRHKEIAKELMDKMRPTQVGSKNPNWRGGIQTENSKKINKERNTKDSRIWRKNVLKRDKVCTICGETENLEAHHINSWKQNIELRTDEGNGVCLCKYCHHIFHKQYGFGNNTEEQFINFRKENAS